MQDRAALILPILEKKAAMNGFTAAAQELLATLKAKVQPSQNLHMDSKHVNLQQTLQCISFRSLLRILLQANITDTHKNTDVANLLEKLRRSVGMSLVF